MSSDLARPNRGRAGNAHAQLQQSRDVTDVSCPDVMAGPPPFFSTCGLYHGLHGHRAAVAAAWAAVHIIHTHVHAHRALGFDISIRDAGIDSRAHAYVHEALKSMPRLPSAALRYMARTRAWTCRRSRIRFFDGDVQGGVWSLAISLSYSH